MHHGAVIAHLFLRAHESIGLITRQDVEGGERIAQLVRDAGDKADSLFCRSFEAAGGNHNQERSAEQQQIEREAEQQIAIP